ncbi:tRNA synthetases class I (M)-domain-containing protein [Lipomyces oligophaga]|uniref:tRNA synthetases class I (M)-domain-containing protein n=1 Tax=Lipomyces oligophaga TaxID=45792 RepID=UPI0034CE7ACF
MRSFHRAQIRIELLFARNYSTKKPFYVTTPIFYVNAQPHIGHLYSMCLADLQKRWHLFSGRDSFLLTGTDEHGMKVQQSAAKGSKEPQQFCDEISETFRRLARAANISVDRFIRTTDDDHVRSVQKLWRILRDNGFIYKSKHEGWYCVSEEVFYAESETQAVIDPMTRLPSRMTIETGKPVDWISEENYYFKLSAFQKPLLKLYEDNPVFVHPKGKLAEVRAVVENGLQDLSISRPTSRVPWGIPVPDDNSQTVYVWLDALTNYLTAAGFADPDFDLDLSRWPASLHIVGKDIIRFHSIYWPAFLLAANLPVPEQILVHSHWQINSKKISKSDGNVVDPYYIMDLLGVDSTRYYLFSQDLMESDGSFDTEAAIARRASDLVNKYGNLVSRTCSLKFDLAGAVRQVSELPSARQDNAISILEFEDELLAKLNTLATNVAVKMESYNIPGAISEIWEVLQMTNKFVDLCTPWSKQQRERGNTPLVIYTMADAARIISIVLQPFLPDISSRALDILDVDPKKRTLQFAQCQADWTFGKNFKQLHLLNHLP